MNYWQIRVFQGEPLLITKLQAVQVMKELDKGKKHLFINGEMIAAGNIAGVDESNKPVKSDAVVLGDGKSKPQPTVLANGSVRAIWAKKRVTGKQWDTEYSKRPGYHRLEDEGSDIWVGFTYIPLQGEPMPNHIEEVTDAEFDRLERKNSVVVY